MGAAPSFVPGDDSPRAASSVRDGDDGALLDAYSAAVVAASEQVGAAVVHVEVAQAVRSNGGEGQRRGSGSGFAFTPDGFILTNSHVVHGARTIHVSFADGASCDADLVGDDPDTDVAVIRIGGHQLPTAIDTAKWVVEQLLQFGRVRRGYLGVAGATVALSRRAVRYHELDAESGVRVESVEPGGRAKRSGVEPGDIIIGYDGERVAGIDDLQRTLTAERIDKATTVTLLRRAQKLELPIQADELPPRQ